MSEIKVSQLQHWIEQRRESLVHPSWITGIPIGNINWHMPVIIGDVPAIQNIHVPFAVMRDNENLKLYQAQDLKIQLTPPPPQWERSSNRQRGVRFTRMNSVENMMGFYDPNQESDLVMDISPDDFPFGDKKSIKAIDHGYLLNTLICCDDNLWGRWRDWQNLYLAGELPKNGNISRIPFCNPPDRAGDIMEFLLDQVSPTWRRDATQRQRVIHYFLRYMLWAFGHHAQPSQPVDVWDGRTHDRLSYSLQRYLRRLMLYPAAHFSLMLKNMLDAKVLPQGRAVKLAKEVFPGRRNDYRDSLFVVPEPCGTTVLAASNHSYEIHGIGTDSWMAIATILDCYLFAPWVVFPYRWLSNRDSEEGILSVISRTQTAMDAHKVNRHFFKQTEPDPDAPDIRPFQIVCRLDFDQDPEDFDLAQELMLRLQDGAPLLPFSQALPPPPETKLLLPTRMDIQRLRESQAEEQVDIQRLLRGGDTTGRKELPPRRS